MRYPPQFLDRIRQSFRLSEVIGRRISVRRAGREYHAICPFHKEKTPSFTVNDLKGFYHCFGCGAHGDVIGFIKEYEGIPWGQAVEALAREAGLPLPALTPEVQQQMEREERGVSVLEKAAQWFSWQLERPSGMEVREYLARRGVTREAQADFRLGYAPDTREGLMSLLLEQGVTLDEMLAVGALIRTDSGQTHDRFRGRVIFPIRNVSGDVVGFGGRLMVESDRAPKYLNSPQTEWFDKGRLLYNADQARAVVARSDKKQLLVAEGYMDVIALHQAGFAEVVAPLGTAVTEEHLRLLWQMAEEPTFCLDGDNAGMRAMRRVALLALPLLKPGKSLRFCLLPAGEDPDSLVKKHGVNAMQSALNASISLADMLWDTEFLEHSRTTPERRAAAEQGLLKAVAGIQDPTVRRAYTSEMRERVWKERQQHFTPRGKGKLAKHAEKEGVYSTQKLMAATPSANEPIKRYHLYMREIFAIMQKFPSILEEAEMEEILSSLAPEDAVLQEYQAYLLTLAVQREEGASLPPDLPSLGNPLPPYLSALFRRMGEEGAEQQARAAVRKLALHIHALNMEREMKTILSSLGDDTRELEALREIQQQHRMIAESLE